ncbi:amino acid permease [Strigomonas culicis]|uniref:Amino acid permease n=1 Tax=Strigomonas culicis TaxID=28005 RepID=S9WMP5_9TRYP|nr:amino acid permease [Strigomonas culicis]|eukprot:EPY37225.1 amino acid permease [Strigomonas culicis]
MGTIYLILIFLLTVFSFRILALAQIKTGIRSYEGMAGGLFGKGGDIFTAVIMFVKCFGACIAYVICVSDVWSAFLKDDRVTGYYSTLSFRRVLTVVTFIVFMLPLSLPKHINSIRYVSLVGVSFIVFFVFCVIAHSCMNGLQDGLHNKDLQLFRVGNSAISGMGKFMFAYLCQSNYFEVANEVKPRLTVRRMEAQCFGGMIICTILYWLSGFFGYVDFGSGVKSSLLTVYLPLKDLYFAVAYCGIVVKLCVAFALHILPCRDSAHHLIGWHLETVAWWKNAVLCSVLSLVSLLCGLFIPNVNIVFGLLGSFTGGFIAFVFPSFFYIYSGGFTVKEAGWYNIIGTMALLLSGIIVICFGTTSTIFDLVA